MSQDKYFIALYSSVVGCQLLKNSYKYERLTFTVFNSCNNYCLSSADYSIREHPFNILCADPPTHRAIRTYRTNKCAHLKEACYSKVPVGISLQINYFPVLTVLEFCFIACKSCHESTCSLSRPNKCPLWPLEPRKLSSWDEIPTIWDRLRSRMLRSHKNNCILSP